MAQVQHVYGFQHMLPMLQKWAAGLKVDLAACRVPQPPRGELHLPSYMAAPLDEASAHEVLHPFLLRPFGGEAFLSFGAVYRGGKARVLANQGWARAFYDEGTINAMISQQGLTAEEVAASVVAPDDRDYLAACFDHCFFGTETATVEVVHVIEVRCLEGQGTEREFKGSGGTKPLSTQSNVFLRPIPLHTNSACAPPRSRNPRLRLRRRRRAAAGWAPTAPPTAFPPPGACPPPPPPAAAPAAAAAAASEEEACGGACGGSPCSA